MQHALLQWKENTSSKDTIVNETNSLELHLFGQLVEGYSDHITVRRRSDGPHTLAYTAPLLNARLT